MIPFEEMSPAQQLAYEMDAAERGMFSEQFIFVLELFTICLQITFHPFDR